MDIAPDLIARLAAHRTIGHAPPHELAWIAAHGQSRHIAAGELVYQRGAPIEELFIVLSGRFSIRINRGAGPRKVTEWGGGDVAGLLPYSRLSTSPGDTLIDEPTEFLAVPRDAFPEMIRECPVVTATLVHVMLDRARLFNASDLNDEKMASLGKLAAGLAHELNNPASAVVRSAKGLAEGLAEAESAARALGAARLTDAQLAAIDRLHHQCISSSATPRSPVAQADHEDAIAEWLESHGADVNTAQPLAESPVTVAGLDDLATRLDEETLRIALQWVGAHCGTRKLVGEIESAAVRIYDLVAAVKGFTHMDQATVPKLVDLAQGLRDTVAVLKAKARSKSVHVTLDVAPDLPPVAGFGGELNQVWSNLIDNALDAVANSGHVDVSAFRQHQSVVVRVTDDGPGVPAEIHERVFDPFFTTKPVGQGTGLGLDIVRRLVRRHDGEIDLESKPGHTEFRVILPAALRSPGER